MSYPKVVPYQPPSSPCCRVSRRLPTFSGTQVSVNLDERAYNALQALARQHQQGIIAVLCEVIDRERAAAPNKLAAFTYSGALDVIAWARGCSRSAVMRDGLVSLYRKVFGRDPEGRVLAPRVQQFEAVRGAYANAHKAKRRAGKSKAEAQRAAEDAARSAWNAA